MFDSRCWKDDCKKEMWCCEKKVMPKPMYADCECKFDMKMPMKEHEMGCCQKKMW